MTEKIDEKIIKKLMKSENISRETAIYQINRWS